MRVLAAFEETHRAYADAIVSVLRSTYPYLEVLTVAGLRELRAQLARFDPHLLISISHAVPLNSRQGRLSWVELSVDPNRPSRICIDGQRWESLNPSLAELLEVVEQTESILAGATDPKTTGEGAC